MMTGQRQSVERLFGSALTLAPDDRQAFLKDACKDTPALEPLVWELLREADRMGSFLEKPLFAADRGTPANATTACGTSGTAATHHSEPLRPFKPRLAAGEILDDRFLIVRLIARGGMGEVYEVADRRLQGVHLALKTILTQIADDPGMQKRFEREVLLAREIVHPNLCPIYDIFHCHQQNSNLTFLTMKLLPGETLAARIGREGQLPLQEARAIIHQIGAALVAAHNAGILHRDIKASNIMLDGSGDQVHVCVMDFGLAHAYLTENHTLSAAGLAGTPAYMAPELFRGHPPSKSSDVYAFGIVAYEIFTGRQPRFNSSNELQTEDEPLFNELPAQWRHFIEGCLKRDISDRYHSVQQALAAVLPLGPSALDHATKPHHLSRREMLKVGAGASLALAGGVWFEWPRIDQQLHPLPDRRFVALMAWPAAQNESAAIVSTVLGTIRNRLARAEAYVKNLLIISPADLPTTGIAIPTPADSINVLGANLVLAASLHLTASTVTLLLQVLDSATQRVLRKRSITSSHAQLSALSDKGSLEAVRLLGLPEREKLLTDTDELHALSAEAFLDFTTAEQLAAQPNNTGLDPAILKYIECLEREPRFHLGYAKLAMTYLRKYRLEHDAALITLARSNAEKAADSNSQSAKGLLSRAQVFLYTGDANESLSYFAKSLKADPGNPETLLFKAQAFRYLNRWPDAEQVYRDILKERPNYWPANNELGWMLARQAKYQQAAEAFGAAAMAAPNVATPLANLGTMYVDIGKHDEAIDASKRSIARSPNATALNNLGNLAFIDKDYKAALAYYQRAAALEPTSHLVWRNIGDCYAMFGETALVRDSYTKAARLLSEGLRLNPRNGFTWMTLAFYHAKIGAAAEADADIANAESRGAQDVKSQFMKVQTLAVLGRRKEALSLLLECMKKGLSPVEVNLALDLRGIREDPRYLSQVAQNSSNRP